MRIVLDTGLLWRPEILENLRAFEGTVVLPAVAYAERRRQMIVSGQSPDSLDVALSRARFSVEPFGPAEAARAASFGLGDADWRRLARDAMIAAHVRAGDRLWTTNPRDFLHIGLDQAEVVAIP